MCLVLVTSFSDCFVKLYCQQLAITLVVFFSMLVVVFTWVIEVSVGLVRGEFSFMSAFFVHTS